VKNKKIPKKYYTVETVPESNSKSLERGNTDTNNTQIHYLPLSWSGTGTFICSGWVRLAAKADDQNSSM
jgi:hypothetical protein